jgi:hypothetical protein
MEFGEHDPDQEPIVQTGQAFLGSIRFVRQDSDDGESVEAGEDIPPYVPYTSSGPFAELKSDGETWAEILSRRLGADHADSSASASTPCSGGLFPNDVQIGLAGTGSPTEDRELQSDGLNLRVGDTEASDSNADDEGDEAAVIPALLHVSTATGTDSESTDPDSPPQYCYLESDESL